jgi:hypothetical protein
VLNVDLITNFDIYISNFTLILNFDSKSCLEERIAIENEYAEKLGRWSSYWYSKSDTAVSATVSNSDDDDINPSLLRIMSSGGGIKISLFSSF